MISLRFLLLLLVLGALIVSGVLEVQFHPDRVKSLTGGVGAFDAAAAPAQIKGQALMFKRRLEQRLLKDEQRRADLALAALRDDLASLQSKLEQPDPAAAQLVPDVKLLNDSLRRLDRLAEEVSIDTLAAMLARSQELRQTARDLHAKLVSLAESDEAANTALAEVLAELDEQLNPSAESETSQQPAEPSDEPAANPSPRTSALPLTF